MHICQYLAEHQVPFESLFHPPAFTAQRRAHYLGLPGGQVAKSVLLAGPSGYLVAVLPATQQVDTEILALEFGGPVRVAESCEVARVFTDCEWGVVVPFGTRYGLPIYLDDSLAADAWIVLELNSHCEAVRMRCGDFERLERPHRMRLGRS